MKNFITLLVCLGFFAFVNGQERTVTDVRIVKAKTPDLAAADQEGPKLVVGIVVDQMRYDYLTRFWKKYGEGGFKRMIRDGFNCRNNHYNYIPTYTGPGHASVYTGTTPKNHGIIANNWYDKVSKEEVYCTTDMSVNPVGTKSDDDRMSPRRMLTTTFSDENRLFTQFKGKSIGISIKDRGAILPAGHSANAAYWFHGSGIGKWVTSSYYVERLPKWVDAFNARKNIDSYLKEWNTLYNISDYTESGEDLNTYERGFTGKETATFPYDLKKLKDDNYGYSIIKSSPYGNTLTTDFAIAAIEGEQLGKDNFTDVLTVSYSSTDYIGHNFGVNSKEIEDTYIRLDKDLERFLNILDEKVGKNSYTVFLTADHGAVDVPSYLQSVKIPAGYFDSKEFDKKLNNFLLEQYEVDGLVENISNGQIFLNRAKIKEGKIDHVALQEAIVGEIINYKHISTAYSSNTLRNNQFTQGIASLLQQGYHHKKSGDVLFVLHPSVISYSRTGSTHGSGFLYDTHVPLIFYGKGIQNGGTSQKTTIDQIAPTISTLLGISFPNGATGSPIYMILDDDY